MRTWISFCLVLLASSALEAAEELPDLDVASLSEQDFLEDIPVVLTATRLAQPVTEAPMATTVIDRRMIRLSGAREIAEIFKLVPGFLVSYDNGHTPIVAYHGLSDQYSRRMQVLIDGRSVYLPFLGGVEWSTLAISIDDIERIEVIRGPNAAAYGANSFLGVINIITRHASETTGAFYRANRGNTGIQDDYLSLGRSFGDVDMRFSGGRRHDRGFDDRADTQSLHYGALRTDYRASVQDIFELHAGFNNGPREIDSMSLMTKTDRHLVDQYQHVKWQHSFNIDQELSLQYFHSLHSTDELFDQIPFGPALVTLDNSVRSERHDVEAQHTYQVSADTRLVWGGSLRRDTLDAPEGYLYQKDELINDLFRLFINTELRLTPKLLLNTGLMYEENDLVDEELSPRIGINYVMSPQHSFRLTASQATRTPSLGEDHADYRAVADVGGTILTPRLFLGPENLQSERIRSIEFGYLLEVQEPRISLDLKLFRDQIQDLISPDDISAANTGLEALLVPSYGVFANVADARVHGAEATIDYQPDPLLRLYLSHSTIVIQGENRISGVDTTKDSAPRHATAIMLSSLLPAGPECSLMYYRIGKFDGLGSGEMVPLHRRVDVRLAFPLDVFQTEGTIALVGQNLLDDYLEWRDDNPFETRYFFSLSLRLD